MAAEGNSKTMPALSPPPGHTSNLTDPPSIEEAIIAGLSVCLAVSTFSALSRCYAQWYLFKRLVWADFWMILGWAFQVAFAAFLFACIPYGAGRHLWDVSMHDYDQIRFLLFIDYILYDIAILGPKIAILLQLKDIFAAHQRNIFFWATAFLVGVNVIFYIALSFALIFQCNPIAKGWDPTIPGECLNQEALFESSGSFNIVSDFLIFVLPISVVWRLQLPVRARLGVASAFGVGLLGCLCSAIRLYYTKNLDSSGDATYLVFQMQLWSIAEMVIATLIANVIIVPRFIRRKRGLTSTHSYTGHGSSTIGRPEEVVGKRQLTSTSERMEIPSYRSYIELTETSDSHTNSYTDSSIIAQSHSNHKQKPPVQRQPQPISAAYVLSDVIRESA